MNRPDLIKTLEAYPPIMSKWETKSLGFLAPTMRLEILKMAKEIEDSKEVIKELLNTYIINLNDNGQPKASITDIMKLIDRATNLITPNQK